MRSVRFALSGVLLLLLLLVCGAVIPRPFLAPVKASSGSDDLRRILVLSGPIHSDIAIPLDDATRSAFPFLAPAGIPVGHPEARWLIVGWGGRAFYLETPTWADLKPLPVLRALTVDRSVLHVDVAGSALAAQPGVAAFDVAPESLARLIAFVAGSFALETGTVAIPDAGYGRYDRFFEARGFFNVLIGCNTWTAAALRTAGLRSGLWTPLPQSLVLSLRLFNGPDDAP
ncbi:TIGR02117 family protein [Pleomorphomonas sp. NRK KF1]|uniref:TIGR02117 family protein n=1 Tax=Pleomorphomonas sp. NRK KF1 TaxID=2943000 RepID=UPI002044860B|nr:TIGR02117 family protein [Pleomorphomonas sp. NRK KF1]MCM5555387.1 TIGR02117 family protein [Pleomorphomonas sp. NRK KF1]